MKIRSFAAILFAAALLFTACETQTVPDDTETTRAETAAPPETEAVTVTDTDDETKPVTTEAATDTETEEITETETETETEAETDAPDLSYADAYTSSGFLRYLSDNYGQSVTESIKAAVSGGAYDDGIYYSLTGKSVYVLFDEYRGATYKKSRAVTAADGGVIRLGFCGDIMFADGQTVMNNYINSGKDASALVSADLLSIMKNCDVLMANNEFTVSSRGTKQNKSFTFRGAPENLNIYHEIGVDFVSAANNHVYDYGLEAFLDTIDALEEYGVDSAGAGRNIKEASEPFIYVINGRKIAVLCGSRAEKNRKTPTAGEDSPGIFGMYDDADMIDAVKKADGECDLVIILAHWGKEFSPTVEDVIREQGRRYIDAGADLIIGAHAHRLQGMEFYKDGFIAYNLGNFLFADPGIKTGMLQIDINSADLTFSVDFIPCIQDTDRVWLCKGGEKTEVLSYLRSVSPDVRIGDDGHITAKN